MVAADARRRGIGQGAARRRPRTGRAGAGVRKLELHVFPHNEPAIRLYEQLRLRAGGLPQGALPPRAGDYVDAILMAYEVPLASGRVRRDLAVA